MEIKHKNTATILHLSALSQYFIPFGNFILPIIIWSSFKKDSAFVESHGRNAINFQLSIFLYTIILFLASIAVLIFSIFNQNAGSSVINEDFFLENLAQGNWTAITVLVIFTGMVFFLMKSAEFFLIIYAGVKASNGQEYQYPATIRFIRARKTPEFANLQTAFRQ